MPTSARRLEARANAYMHASICLHDAWSEDPMERGEGYDLAERLEREYYRLMKLAGKRKEKEKELEHRRKPHE